MIFPAEEHADARRRNRGLNDEIVALHAPYGLGDELAGQQSVVVEGTAAVEEELLVGLGALEFGGQGSEIGCVLIGQQKGLDALMRDRGFGVVQRSHLFRLAALGLLGRLESSKEGEFRGVVINRGEVLGLRGLLGPRDSVEIANRIEVVAVVEEVGIETRMKRLVGRGIEELGQ